MGVCIHNKGFTTQNITLLEKTTQSKKRCKLIVLGRLSTPLIDPRKPGQQKISGEEIRDLPGR